MAVTVARRRLRSAHGAALLILVWFQVPALADRAADIRVQISSIGTALSSGSASEAMTPFDKSYASYGKLRDYFEALSALQAENEVDVLDEQDTDAGSTVTIKWTLTLTNPSTSHSDARTANINVRFALKRGKWKIVDFSPIDIFNPLQGQTPKR